jgi:hypothetical protein
MRIIEIAQNKSIYRSGMCDAMALAIHEITKLPLGGWQGSYTNDYDEDETELCHICVVLSFKGKKWMDVDGVHTGVPDNCYFNNSVEKIDLVPLSTEDVKYLYTMEGVSESDIEQAKKFINNDPVLSRLVNNQDAPK